MAALVATTACRDIRERTKKTSRSGPAIPAVRLRVSRTLVLVSRVNGHLTPAAKALYDLMQG